MNTSERLHEWIRYGSKGDGSLGIPVSNTYLYCSPDESKYVIWALVCPHVQLTFGVLYRIHHGDPSSTIIRVSPYEQCIPSYFCNTFFSRPLNLTPLTSNCTWFTTIPPTAVNLVRCIKYYLDLRFSRVGGCCGETVAAAAAAAAAVTMHHVLLNAVRGRRMRIRPTHTYTLKQQQQKRRNESRNY